MTNVEARNFLNSLFAELWDKPDSLKVDAFYHQNVIGYFGDQVLNINDLKNRAEFCQKRGSRFKTEILDIVAEENKMAVRLKQTEIKKDNNELFEHHPIVIYQLRDNKISHLWFLTDRPFNYKKTLE